MFFPILTVVPGLVALLVIPNQIQGNFNMILPLMFLHYYPAGLLGVGITALLSSFMSGMAGNVTAFNTVWTYDIYQNYIAPRRSDHHYLTVGRLVTVVGILISIATAYSARAFPNIFDYWALLSGIFVGAPFGTFVLGAFTTRVRGTAAFCWHAGRNPQRHRPLFPLRSRLPALRQRAGNGLSTEPRSASSPTSGLPC